MSYPRIRYQTIEYNKRQTEKAIRIGRQRKNQVTDSMHQAATVAGEFIAARNRGRSSSRLLDDITKHYKPDYLEGRQEEGR